MNDIQPYLIETTHPQTYSFPRLKHLPVREQPVFPGKPKTQTHAAWLNCWLSSLVVQIKSNPPNDC